MYIQTESRGGRVRLKTNLNRLNKTKIVIFMMEIYRT